MTLTSSCPSSPARGYEAYSQIFFGFEQQMGAKGRSVFRHYREAADCAVLCPPGRESRVLKEQKENLYPLHSRAWGECRLGLADDQSRCRSARSSGSSDPCSVLLFSCFSRAESGNIKRLILISFSLARLRARGTAEPAPAAPVQGRAADHKRAAIAASQRRQGALG